MTTALTLRLVKGTPLTNSELDANFSALKATADQALTTANAGLGGSSITTHLAFSGSGYITLPLWSSAPNTNTGTVGYNTGTGRYEFATGSTVVNFVRLNGDTMTGALHMGSNAIDGSNASFTGGTINNMAIGGSTAASGAFTSLSASGTVSGAGFVAWAASPPAIGGTAPNTAAFTTLSASGTVSGAGFTARFATPGPIGSTTASTGAFTTLAAIGTATFGANAASGEQLTINAAAATNRTVSYQTAGVQRWLVGANNGAESGSNAGSDFFYNRYSDAGSFIDQPITISRANGLVSIKGSSTNDNAPSGYLGEVISSSVLQASAVTLTNGTVANVTTISLTAGDWDVSGEVWISVGTGGATLVQAGINNASITLPSDSSLSAARVMLAAALTASNTQILTTKACRISLASTTTIYLMAAASFPSGTTTAYGNIIARRRR